MRKVRYANPDTIRFEIDHIKESNSGFIVPVDERTELKSQKR